MNMVDRAGLVVADVAVRCVDRKSVNSINGSRSMLHLEVNTVIVSTISSRLFWCLIVPSE
jgi:Trk K+ transport system NAD-binding subunit